MWPGWGTRALMPPSASLTSHNVQCLLGGICGPALSQSGVLTAGFPVAPQGSASSPGSPTRAPPPSCLLLRPPFLLFFPLPPLSPTSFLSLHRPDSFPLQCTLPLPSAFGPPAWLPAAPSPVFLPAASSLPITPPSGPHSLLQPLADLCHLLCGLGWGPRWTRRPGCPAAEMLLQVQRPFGSQLCSGVTRVCVAWSGRSGRHPSSPTLQQWY